MIFRRFFSNIRKLMTIMENHSKEPHIVANNCQKIENIRKRPNPTMIDGERDIYNSIYIRLSYCFEFSTNKFSTNSYNKPFTLNYVELTNCPFVVP